MNGLFKRMVICIASLGMIGIMGCSSSQKSGDGDWERCNATSAGKMAEMESGFFYAYDDILYYADKENISQWVAVCNKPDCMHIDHTCNAYLLSYNQMIQKEGKLYGISSSGLGKLLNITTDVPFIWEIAMDGSGTKKVYDIPVGNGNWISGCSFATFHKRVVSSNGYLDEKGIFHNDIVRLEENENGEAVVNLLHQQEEDSVLLMGGNVWWSLRGDDVLVTSIGMEEDDTTLNLAYGDREALEFIEVPEDVNLLGGYLSGDILTYYEQNEGFYEMNLLSGEKKLILESQMENARGYVLTEEYFVEYTCYYEEKYEAEENRFQFYDGTKWMEVSLEEIPNVERGIFPISVASDRIFFGHRMDSETKTGLCYFMLEDKALEFVYCGEIGKTLAIEEESSSSEEEKDDDTIRTEFEEVTIFDNEDGILKVTGGSQVDNSYMVDLFWNIGDSGRDYGISVYAAINGIYCGSVASFYTMTDGSLQTDGNYQIVFAKDEYEIYDIYSVEEFTDIALMFYVNDWETGEVLAEQSVHLYPKGEEAITYFEREPQSTDVIVVENEFVSATLIDYGQQSIANDSMTFFVKNKTDQDIRFVASELSINGLSTEPNQTIWRLNENGCAFITISLMDEMFLQQYQITEIGTIQLLLQASFYDIGTNEIIGETFLNEMVTLHPQGEEQAWDYVRPAQETDVVLVDNNYITLTLTGYEDAVYSWLDNFTVSNGKMNFLLKNKTDGVVGFYVQDFSTNGITSASRELKYLLAGDIYFYQDSAIDSKVFKEQEITKAEKIEFLFHTCNQNGEMLESEQVILYPNGNDDEN